MPTELVPVAVLPVILSGGSGARLWPLSREKYPKQLLSLLNDQSLIQATAGRLTHFPQADVPLVVCNQEHRFVIDEQLSGQCRLLLEPFGRNTAPALTLAALAATLDGGDPVMVAMPADHDIRNIDAFTAAIAEAVERAGQGEIVTLGISPDHVETAYGHIQFGSEIAGARTARSLLRFVEKPALADARQFFDSCEYLWNSGIFITRASVWLSAINACRPEIAGLCRRAMAAADSGQRVLMPDAAAFSECPSDSIDYAVMESLTHAQPSLPAASVIPFAGGWSDIGSWDALWAALAHDAAGNAVRGDVLLAQCENTLAISSRRLIACVGTRNLVVVETDDAVLVLDQQHAQAVKTLVASLKRDGRPEASWHRKVYRPWGWYDGIDAGDRFQVKHIMVKPGASLSLQMHYHRAEHWVVVRGTARVVRDDEVILLTENQSTYIPLGVRHRLENPGCVPLEIVEIQSGSYLGEDDIVRFDDRYGRK